MVWVRCGLSTQFEHPKWPSNWGPSPHQPNTQRITLLNRGTQPAFAATLWDRAVGWPSPAGVGQALRPLRHPTDVRTLWLPADGYCVAVDLAAQYQASDETVRSAVRELLALGVPGDGGQPLVGFHLAPGSRFGVIARRTELAVFSEAFGETKETLAHEYARYEDVSGFFVVIDTSTGMPAGASRYVDGGVELNPTLRNLETIGSMPEVTAQMRELLETHPGTWDITTLEIYEAYRGHHGGFRAMGTLGRMIVHASQLYRVPAISEVASEHSHQTQATLGFPLQPLTDELLVYPDGVELLVAFADFTDAEAAMLAHLERMRTQAAQNPAVAQELAVLEPFILGVATGEGYDEYIDMTPR